jgi:hypothetical protein
MENKLTPYEEWKEVPGYNGYYQVSNFSRVKSIDRTVERHGHLMNIKGIIMTPTSSKQGYPSHRFSLNGKLRTENVHRLVAEAFIPNPENKKFVNHKNGLKHDNRIENLEWCTCSENCLHAVRTGLTVQKKMEHNHRARPVIQFDLSGNFINRYKCALYAVKEHGFDSGSISKACSGKLHTAYGFIWRFEDTLSPYELHQLSKYKNILPTAVNTKDEDLEESGLEELNRLAEWQESMAAIEELDK